MKMSKVRKGSIQLRGDASNHHILDKDQVIEIKKLSFEKLLSPKEILEKFNDLTYSNLRSILTGRTWKDV